MAPASQRLNHALDLPQFTRQRMTSASSPVPTTKTERQRFRPGTGHHGRNPDAALRRVYDAVSRECPRSPSTRCHSSSRQDWFPGRVPRRRMAPGDSGGQLLVLPFSAAGSSASPSRSARSGCCSQPHALGRSEGSARTGTWFPPVPQLVALWAGSAGASSPRNWPATRITVDAAG
jgi:hypothetical protein